MATLSTLLCGSGPVTSNANSGDHHLTLHPVTGKTRPGLLTRNEIGDNGQPDCTTARFCWAAEGLLCPAKRDQLTFSALFLLVSLLIHTPMAACVLLFPPEEGIIHCSEVDNPFFFSLLNSSFTKFGMTHVSFAVFAHVAFPQEMPHAQKLQKRCRQRQSLCLHSPPMPPQAA